MKRALVLVALAAPSLAGFSPEWDTLTNYDRSVRHTVTVDVQRITTLIVWTNPVTTSAVTNVQTYAACHRPDATTDLLYGQPMFDTNGVITSRVANGWSWTSEIVSASVMTLPWSNRYYQVTGAVIRAESVPMTAQPVSVSTADKLLIELYEALLERALAVGHFVASRDSIRDALPDFMKPSLFGSAALRRLGPGGREHEYGFYLQTAKTLLEGLVSHYVNTGHWPTAYEATPFASGRMWSASTILAAVGAPSNYFSFTPMRDWEGRWTNYPEIITGHWVMEPPQRLEFDWTNFVDVVVETNTPFTNVVIDACGNTYEIIGTNGRVVTFVCTNDPTASGWTHADYGLKYIKPILEKLTITERPVEYYASTRLTYYVSSIGGETEVSEGDYTALAEMLGRLWSNGHAMSPWYPVLAEVRSNVLFDAPGIHGGAGLVWELTNSYPFWVTARVEAVVHSASDLHEGASFNPLLTARPEIWLIDYQRGVTNSDRYCEFDEHYDDGTTEIAQRELMTSLCSWPTGLVGAAANPWLFLGDAISLSIPEICRPPIEEPGVGGDSSGGSGWYVDGPSYPHKSVIFRWNVPGGFRYSSLIDSHSDWNFSHSGRENTLVPSIARGW